LRVTKIRSFRDFQRGSENFHKENCETVVENFKEFPRVPSSFIEFEKKLSQKVLKSFKIFQRVSKSFRNILKRTVRAFERVSKSALIYLASLRYQIT